jgi:Zinc dependent phospholipase C
VRSKWRLLRLRTAALIFASLASSGALYGYSVLTHEEIVDLVWTSEIRPLLVQRFPQLTEAEITEAHAYAYGGSVIQDLGYYPFGNKEFSDLLHYARSGDFVLELLSESKDVDEYAFALGALSHYTSDIVGHPAVNQAVALRYPKLRAKYGNSVRYAQDATAHLKVEFGFDTLQVAKNRYAPDQYHEFIGFKVARPLLERTFQVVYGLQLKDVLTHEDLAIGSYRYSVSRLIPEMTKVALQMHKKDLIRETPNFSKKRFLYRLSRSDYEKQWGKTYTKPGLGTRLLSGLLRYFPKIGPFKGMGFDNPTPKTEDLYITSINATVDQYRVYLREVRTNRLVSPNLDLDDGKATKAAEYTLADDTYATLLDKLSDIKFEGVSPQLRDNILEFYSGYSMAVPSRNDLTIPQRVLKELDGLRAMAPSPVAGCDRPFISKFVSYQCSPASTDAAAVNE